MPPPDVVWGPRPAAGARTGRRGRTRATQAAGGSGAGGRGGRRQQRALVPPGDPPGRHAEGRGRGTGPAPTPRARVAPEQNSGLLFRAARVWAEWVPGFTEARGSEARQLQAPKAGALQAGQLPTWLPLEPRGPQGGSASPGDPRLGAPGTPGCIEVLSVFTHTDTHRDTHGHTWTHTQRHINTSTPYTETHRHTHTQRYTNRDTHTYR